MITERYRPTQAIFILLKSDRILVTFAESSQEEIDISKMNNLWELNES